MEYGQNILIDSMKSDIGKMDAWLIDNGLYEYFSGGHGLLAYWNKDREANRQSSLFCGKTASVG